MALERDDTWQRSTKYGSVFIAWIQKETAFDFHLWSLPCSQSILFSFTRKQKKKFRPTHKNYDYYQQRLKYNKTQ